MLNVVLIDIKLKKCAVNINLPALVLVPYWFVTRKSD